MELERRNVFFHEATCRFTETLRMLPPVPVNFRICVKDYEFPDGTRIEKGTPVFLPTHATHFDPQYFPEPNKFKPERFENPPQKGTYAPFGDGPRICIGTHKYYGCRVKFVNKEIRDCNLFFLLFGFQENDSLK